MLKKLHSVRFVLTLGLLLSMLFAGASMYYKIKYWGFSFLPRQRIPVWSVEQHISFVPNGEPIVLSIARPSATKDFKVLNEAVVAKNYSAYTEERNADRIILKAKPQKKVQHLYYRMHLYDNVKGRGKTIAEQPEQPRKPILDDTQSAIASQLLVEATELPGDEVQQLVALFNQNPPEETVLSFLPERAGARDVAQAIIDLLALKNISARIVRGIKLVENRATFTPDVMLEVYRDGMWKVYNIETGKKGIPSDFVIFQRGGTSLLDVSGGVDSVTKFSVMRSLSSSFDLAGDRAKNANLQTWFNYSIYNLPLNQQNAIKWLMIFPLAILVVVLMRNVVGISTMGTFTPMLISMALVETGFGAGLICFALIIGAGMLIRTLLSRLNLLLVPRISSVVIFVILIIQALAVIGYNWEWSIASSALFFPIIIMAWIIERASITWEEDGAVNATKEIVYSVLVAIITYFVIVNEYIRHIMFVFNELNLVILFIVMLLGTYTGYRLTELTRFAPLAKGKSDV